MQVDTKKGSWCRIMQMSFHLTQPPHTPPPPTPKVQFEMDIYTYPNALYETYLI